MYYKAVSSKAIIARVYRDFKPATSGWVYDAIEWIGDAMGIIGHSTGYIRQPIKHCISDYKAKLKCSVDGILGVEYSGRKLRSLDAINTIKESGSNQNGAEWYTLNPNFIQTSFEEGDIIIYALTVPTDSEGFPLVPDGAETKQAITWYVLSMMLANGYKHPVFDYTMAEQRWNVFYPRAQNEGKFPDIDTLDNFRRNWTRTIPDTGLVDVFFDNSVDARETVYTLASDSQGATIIHVETGDDIVGGGTL